MTEAPINPDVALRGMQLDYQITDGSIGLPASMDYSNPGGLYAEFEDLPVPTSVWPITNPLLAFMVVLQMDTPVLIEVCTITLLMCEHTCDHECEIFC